MILIRVNILNRIYQDIYTMYFIYFKCFMTQLSRPILGIEGKKRFLLSRESIMKINITRAMKILVLIQVGKYVN